MITNFEEKWSKLFDENGQLVSTSSKDRIKPLGNKCPNPTCTKGTKHCQKCLREHGIWVCGTTCKGHRVVSPHNRMGFRDGMLYHSNKRIKDMISEKIDINTVFHPNDAEVMKNKYVDLRNISHPE